MDGAAYDLTVRPPFMSDQLQIEGLSTDYRKQEDHNQPLKEIEEA
jgi:hypothetical protein